MNSKNMIRFLHLPGILLSLVLMFMSFAPQSAWAQNIVGLPPTMLSKAREAQRPHHKSLYSANALLSESFDGVIFPPANWDTTVVTGTTQGWSRVTSGFFPIAAPHSGAGMAQFNSLLIFSGNSTRLYTPLLNLSGQTNPTLSFWMYHDTGFPASNDRIQIQISTDGGANYPTTLTTVSRYDGSTGWKLHPVDLSAYSGQNNLRLGFLAISAFGNRIFIDDVSVGPPPTLTYLPLVLKSSPPPPPCFPSPPGESNNVADALIVCSGQTVSGQVNNPFDLDDVYKILAVANQQLTISMNGVGDDADLYLYPPNTTDVNTDPWVDRSINIGNSEFIQGTVLVGGFWYIDIFAFDGQSNYDVTVTLSGPDSTEIKTFNLIGTEQSHDHRQNKLLKK